MAATVADMTVLALLVGVAGVTPRVANAPSLLLGAMVQFLGNRQFAFRGPQARPLGQQAWLFACAEVVTLGLNALGYELVTRTFVVGVAGAVLARAAVSFVVFVAWSHPVWCRIFEGDDPTPTTSCPP